MRSFCIQSRRTARCHRGRRARQERTRHLIERGRQIANELGEIPNKNRAIIATLVRQVEVRPDSIKIHLSRDRLTAVLTSDLREWTIENALPIDTSDRILTLTAPAQRTRLRREMKLLVDDTKDNRAPDIGLLRILARAHDIHVRLIQDTSRTVHDIAREEASALVTFISFCVFVGLHRTSPRRSSTVGSHHNSMPRS